MNESIVIVEAVRTPVGRYGGALKDLNSGELAAIAIKETVKRAGISPEFVDEVILGEVRQTTESSNVARVAGLRAGISESAPGFTINRLCASGMQAIASAVQQVQTGQAEIVVAGGTESLAMHRFIYETADLGETRLNWLIPTLKLDSSQSNYLGLILEWE